MVIGAADVLRVDGRLAGRLLCGKAMDGVPPHGIAGEVMLGVHGVPASVRIGHLQKYFKENTLEEQEYQMGDGKQSVKQAIEAAAKGAKVTVFKRFSLTD